MEFTLYIKDNDFLEVPTVVHYIKESGNGGLFGYSKDVARKQKKAIKSSGYRLATIDEINKQYDFTESKIKELGYTLATKEQVDKYVKLRYPDKKKEAPKKAVKEAIKKDADTSI